MIKLIRFTMTSFPPLSDTVFGTSAAGVTLKLDTIASHKSTHSAWLNALFNSSSESHSPKLIIVSWRIPPHSGLSHFLSVYDHAQFVQFLLWYLLSSLLLNLCVFLY